MKEGVCCVVGPCVGEWHGMRGSIQQGRRMTTKGFRVFSVGFWGLFVCFGVSLMVWGFDVCFCDFFLKAFGFAMDWMPSDDKMMVTKEMRT